VILGVILPALALVTTRRVAALPYTVHQLRIEAVALMMYLVFTAWMLVSGFSRLARVTAEPMHSFIVLSVKLLAFVAIPAAIMRALGHYSIAELVPISLRWRDLRPALWMSLAVLLMQSILGRGLHDIREAHLPVWVLAVAASLSFTWLMIEVGVVEEFFFRVLLQERLAAVLRSTWGGLVLAAVLFGLVHAPGFYLRTAATQEALGSHPFAIYGRRVLDRADLTRRSFHGRFVDANEEFRCPGYRACCRRPPAQPGALGQSVPSDAIAVRRRRSLT
jgi:uncharacterized protein